MRPKITLQSRINHARFQVSMMFGLPYFLKATMRIVAGISHIAMQFIQCSITRVGCISQLATMCVVWGAMPRRFGLGNFPPLPVLV